MSERFSNAIEIDPEAMDDQINCLVFRINAELSKIEQRRRQLTATRLQLQTICNHKFEDIGRDHGGHWHRCRICGLEQRN